MRRGHRTAGSLLLCVLTVLGVWLYAGDLSLPSARLYTVLVLQHPRGTGHPHRPGQECNQCGHTAGDVNQKHQWEAAAGTAVTGRTSTEAPYLGTRPTEETGSTLGSHFSQATSPSMTNSTEIATTGSTVPRQTDTNILIVISYMRSGSTFTADILQHFPNTLYVFEPLHRVVMRVRNELPLTYINGTVRETTRSMLTDSFLKEELHKWLQCRLHELDVHTLFDDFHKVFSRSMRRLPACWKPLGAKLSSLRKCLPQIVSFCQQAKRRLFKFIRLPMHIIEEVFSMYPNLQVIHLLRDPRGTVSSQLRFRGDPNIYNMSKHHCDTVDKDLAVTTALHQRFPSRIKILVYETLASSPVEVARRIYRFAGLTPFKYILNYVTRVTFSKKHINCTFCIIKQNATEAAFKWRGEISDFKMKTIDRNCQRVYNMVGFKSYENIADLELQETFTPRNTSLFI